MATYTGTLRGSHARVATRTGTLRGRHRRADNGAEYRVYKGEDAAPDFTASAFATGSSLPITTGTITLPGAGLTKTINLVTRYRNDYGLESQNTLPETFVIDENGDLVATPPSEAMQVSLSPAAAGAVRLQAQYFADADGINAADTWLIYLTSDGSDPDPSTDTPTEVAMNVADGIASLDWTSSTFSHGATIKVILRTRRSGSPDVDSESVTILSTTASTAGPSAADPDRFIGGPESVRLEQV